MPILCQFPTETTFWIFFVVTLSWHIHLLKGKVILKCTHTCLNPLIWSTDVDTYTRKHFFNKQLKYIWRQLQKLFVSSNIIILTLLRILQISTLTSWMNAPQYICHTIQSENSSFWIQKFWSSQNAHVSIWHTWLSVCPCSAPHLNSIHQCMQSECFLNENQLILKYF